MTIRTRSGPGPEVYRYLPHGPLAIAPSGVEELALRRAYAAALLEELNARGLTETWFRLRAEASGADPAAAATARKALREMHRTIRDEAIAALKAGEGETP